MTTETVGDSADIVLAQQYDRLLRLLQEARTWRSSLISGTTTSLYPPTRSLLEAIAVFDRAPCDHPRAWRVYRPPIAESPEACGYCGAVLAVPAPASPSSSPL